MALPTPKATADDVTRELGLSAKEFDWDNRDDDGVLAVRLRQALNRARTMTYQAVGAGNYASTEATMSEVLAEAETLLACSFMLTQRLIILSSRPQEAPPEEYIDLGILKDIRDDYRSQWATLVLPYQSEDMDKPGTGFAWGATGIDETKADYGRGDYDYQDYDELPSD